MEALSNVPVSLSVSAPTAFLTSFFLASAFVGSLYVWSLKPFSSFRAPPSSPSSFQRDHPMIIFRRFLSLMLVCVAAPPFLAFLAKTDEGGVPFWHLLGVRVEGLFPSIVLPFFLTHVLFMGSHLLNHLEGMNSLYSEPRFWLECLRSPVWMRNHVVAPFTEEFVFRGCMVPLLLPWLGPGLTIVVAPLFFGLAHFHHICEKLMTTRFTLAQIFPSSFFQFLYTSVYGAYSVFLFLRTGHVTAPIVAHAVCNHMGFPNFGDVGVYPSLTRFCLWSTYLLGVVLWVVFLYPITSPEIYGNNVWPVV